jgi:hypothetical protein
VRRVIKSLRVFAALLLLCATGDTAPPKVLSPRQTHAIARYRADLDHLQTRATGSTVEQLYSDAFRLRQLLGGQQKETSIEDISDAEFQDLQKRLTGMIINREEVILAEPDAKFFTELASTYGGKIDREFFDIYAATYPDSVWPVYVEQQTDYSACSAFGAGHMIEAYRQWTDFRTTHPTHYRAEVDRQIERVEESLMSTCACGDRESVLRELRGFVRAFPRSKLRPAVVKRIRELEQGTSEVRFDCSSG